MKKICIVMVLFYAFFMISCGDDSANKFNNNSDGGDSATSMGKLGNECYPNETCNKGLICDVENNVCVEDPENPIDDLDNNPSEPINDNPDTASEQNDDNADSGNPCDSNPCENIKNSTGICTNNGENYSCGCNTNYEWNGSSCSAGTKQAPCEPKPANTVWNDNGANGTFSQTWNGSDWIPVSYPSTFNNKTPGTCVYKCASGYAWNGITCDSAPSTVANCTGLPENAIWNTTDKIVQTFDGTEWEPSTVGVYDLTPTQSECHFICKPNYDWNGSECLAGTQYVECTDLPENAVWNSVSSITQTWNGTEWTPKATSRYNSYECSNECCFKCKLNYKWSDGACVASTRTQNCTGLPYGAQWNVVSSITQTWNGSEWIPSNVASYNQNQSSQECRFKCKTNYTWNSTQQECIADTQSSSCTNLPAGAKWNTYSSVLQTWNGSSWQPDTNGVYNETASKYECRYVCDTHYTWNQTKCVADKQTVNCIELPANATSNTATTVTQTWNGTAWEPSEKYSYSTNSSSKYCYFKCNSGYFYDGTTCMNPCDYKPCEEDEHSNGICSATDWNVYSCECSGNGTYAWDGEECAYTWSKKSSSKKTWSGAISYCNSLTEGGYNDWRLPGTEITTFLNKYGDSNNDSFWTSSSVDANYARAAMNATGFYTTYEFSKSGNFYVRCIRP